MAPAPTATANRPLARPSKVRYFKGKPLDEAVSDESSGEEEPQPQQRIKRVAPPVQDEDVVAGGAGRVIRQGGAVGMKMDLGGVKLGGVKPPVKEEEEEESEEEESEEEDEKPKPTFRKPAPPKAPSEESSEYETDSEEESEEEKKPALRPVFIRKDQRGMTQEKAAQMAEEAAKREEEEREQRKVDSKELAGETIRRELAEKEATDLQPDIDDTDGLDPAAEFEEWRARELARLLREKQAQAERDEERDEIERRRAMPEEQRMREDMEYAEATRAREKGDMAFLQKYYHKGAFHQDDELLKRDYTGATESQVDMSMLPKLMQVRNFGKMSRTKYTHLADQDTSQGGWGTAARPAGGTGIGDIGTTTTGCWNCGGPHLRKGKLRRDRGESHAHVPDCPNNNINDQNAFTGGTSSGMGTSANTAALGSGGGSRGWGDRESRDREGGRYRDEGRERRFDEERRRDRDEGYRRDDRGTGHSRDERSKGQSRDFDDRRGERTRSRSPACA
ncbi:hypothetical protein EHS25_008698 [Saitozyma podzolica]|uniref:Micro-fibrillar-associated protein 1 C-terminal domain-containing protein n=1 Tax=Saitozyma podzolica TaxID=1890683 RepID=A0A427YMH3_9TREE|nr:hypothetical protein EHS25_008698 [Saitozyma podzolica]